MSQQQSFGNGTSPGSGEISSLTPNSGLPATGDGSGNVNVQGLAANAGGNAFPIFSYTTSASQFNLENRTYLSPYVVDPSTTDGRKGTFTTLAAAITQSIADGEATTTDGATIYVRNTVITETISLSTNGINISILGTGGKSNQSILGGNPIFNGSFTYSGNGNVLFSNIDMSSSAVLTMSGSGTFTVTDCYSNASITHSGNGFFFDNSTAGDSSSFNLSGSEFSVRNSSLGNFPITYSGSASSSFQNSNFGGTLAGITSGLLFFNANYLPIIANTMTGGTIEVFNNTFGPHNFFGNTNLTYQKGQSEIGNVTVASRPAGTYVATFHDQYIGVTSTASAVAVTIPVSNVIKNQIFVVKDESGGAATNNITITPASGTIDGNATYVINTNYGAVELIFDGTNFFSKSAIDQVASGNFLQVANNLSDVGNRNTALSNLMPATPAKGTICVFDGTDWVNLGVGTDGDVLTANSASSDGVDWEPPASGGAATAFYAYASTPQSNVLGGAAPGPYTVLFDATTRNDAGLSYNPVTGLTTALVSGFYCFCGVVYLNSTGGFTGGTEVIASSIGSVNSQVFYQKLTVDAANGLTNICLPFTWMLNMGAGETVGVQAFCNNGVQDVSVIGNSLSPSALRTFSSFSGFKVGT